MCVCVLFDHLAVCIAVIISVVGVCFFFIDKRWLLKPMSNET